MAVSDRRTLPAITELPAQNRKYLYRQLYESVLNDVQQGHYHPGDRIPSLDELSRNFGINRLTARKAIDQLKKEGWLYSVFAQGTYVAERLPGRAGLQRDARTLGLFSQVLVAGRIGPYHAELLAGLQQQAAERDYAVALLNSRTVLEAGHLKDMNLSGLIFMGPMDTGPVQAMVGQGPALVLLDINPPALFADTVAVDNQEGGRQAVAHLLELGHRHIAFVTGPQGDQSVVERLRGAALALKTQGLELSRELVFEGDYTRECVGPTLLRLLKADACTAIFFFNDEMATTGLSVLREMGRRVPEDISIIGFDDIEWARTTHPTLSTIRVEKQALGRLAVQRLWARMEQPKAPPLRVLVPTSLVVRQSTGLRPAGRAAAMVQP